MSKKAPAKINLWLRVFPPDETGYHPLDTLFCTVDLADEINVSSTTASGIHLAVRGHDVGPSDKNLAYRAALEYFTTTGLNNGIGITLEKVIPAGAGLGGGSSDAATVLKSLNEMNGNVVSNEDLLAMGARLGSDVPFFLCGSSLAHATGRGEILKALNPLPRKPALIVTPEFGVSTPEAYRWIDEDKAWSQQDDTGSKTVSNWDDVAKQATNDFERVLFKRYLELQRIRDSLVEMGATIAMVSGSGSAIFGIFESEAERDKAAARIPRSVATYTGI